VKAESEQSGIAPHKAPAADRAHRSRRRKDADDQFPVLYLRPTEAAAMVRMSRSKFYQLLARGEIASCLIGGLRRVPVTALQKFAAETTR
jgi:excisionase family DNA binding protein